MLKNYTRYDDDDNDVDENDSYVFIDEAFLQLGKGLSRFSRTPHGCTREPAPRPGLDRALHLVATHEHPPGAPREDCR